MEEKPKRRWLRFSLRALFVAMTTVAVGVIWGLHHARERTRVIEMLKAKIDVGITFEYEFQSSGRAPAYLPNAKPPGTPSMKQVLGEYYDSRVRSLELCTPKITDDDVKRLTVFDELDWLALNDASITDESIKYIARLQKLSRLDLENTKITAEGVRALCHVLPNTVINSDWDQVDDELNPKPWAAAQRPKAKGAR
jgi:hypothetical protein